MNLFYFILLYYYCIILYYIILYYIILLIIKHNKYKPQIYPILLLICLLIFLNYTLVNLLK